MKLDLLAMSTRQLLDLYHATASALERDDRGKRVTHKGQLVQERLLVPIPEAAIVVDPLSSRK